jgi:hypothetical protein
MNTANSKKANVIGLAVFAMLFAPCDHTAALQPTKIPRIGYLNDGALKCADVVVSTIPV